MATPRYKLVDNEIALGYHLVSNCVRDAWLCGRDNRKGKDYSHRKQWLVERMLALARCFAVEIDAYAVMSNHFHLVVHYDPKACDTWSAEEVAKRWVDAFPPTERGKVAEERKPETRELVLGDPERLERARRTLGSLSCFMKHLPTMARPYACTLLLTYCFSVYLLTSVRAKGAIRITPITTNLQLFPVAFQPCRSVSPRDVPSAS